MKKFALILSILYATQYALSDKLKLDILFNDGSIISYEINNIDSLSMIEPMPTAVTDIEGHTYRVGIAGVSCWMLENLNVSRYDTLSPLGGKILSESADSTFLPYTTSGSYGRLYNWSAAMGIETEDDAVNRTQASSKKVQGICPNKYHLPSNPEIMAVSRVTGDVGSNPLRSSDAWQYDYEELFQVGESPVDGFMSYPDGYAKGAEQKNFGRETSYWSADAMSESSAGEIVLTGAGSLTYDGGDKRIGRSVRCIWDGQTDRDWLYVYKKDKTVERYRTDKIDKIKIIDNCTDGRVSDVQGNNYTYHRFGSTNWMTEDLRTTQDVPLYTDAADWHNRYIVESDACGGATGYYYSIAAVMGLDDDNAAKYYNSTGVHQNLEKVRGVCPEGWRLPQKADMEKARTFVENGELYMSRGSAVYSDGRRFSYGMEGYIWLSDVIVVNTKPRFYVGGIPYLICIDRNHCNITYSQILGTIPALSCRCVQDLQEPVMHCIETGTSVGKDYNVWENNYPEIQFGTNKNGVNSMIIMIRPVANEPYILAPGYYNSVTFR